MPKRVVTSCGQDLGTGSHMGRVFALPTRRSGTQNSKLRDIWICRELPIVFTVCPRPVGQ